MFDLQVWLDDGDNFSFFNIFYIKKINQFVDIVDVCGIAVVARLWMVVDFLA